MKEQSFISLCIFAILSAITHPGVLSFNVVTHDNHSAKIASSPLSSSIHNQRCQLLQNYPTVQTKSLTMPSTTSLSMFGNIFGGGGDGASALSLNSEGIPVTVYKNSNSDDVEKEGIVDYLIKWADLFTTGNIALTTPVQVEPISADSSATSAPLNKNNRQGIRLLFRNTNTGYKSKKEEKENQSKQTTDSDSAVKKNESKKSKKGEIKQGGVEILVTTTANSSSTSVCTLEVSATRCEFDDDTIVKEMSEETILKELQKAIEVWKRETNKN